MSGVIGASSAGLSGNADSPPSNAVVIAAGANIQAAVNAHPAGTSFLLSAGTYSGQTISPRSGDSFYGQNGQAVLDGGGAQQAFQGQGVSNVTLSGLVITNYAPAANGVGTLGTDGSAVNWAVNACTFTGISVGVPIMIGTGMVVSDCSIHGNQMAGISGYNVTGAVIENNDIYGNNLANLSPFTATGSNAGVKIAQCTNVQILNNTIHDNQSAPGIWTDISCSGTVISGNSISNNGAGGVFLELDYGATVSNNLITNNNSTSFSGFQGGGIYVQNSANANVQNNTLQNNVGGIWVYQSARGSGTQGPWVVNNDVFKNNSIQMTSGQNGYSNSVAASNVQFSNDTYNLSGSAQLIEGGNAVSLTQWQGAGSDVAATPTPTPVPVATPVPTPVPVPVPSAPAALTIGSGADTLALQVSEDAWQGNAQFTVSIDGQQVGGTQTATASHGAGQTQTVNVLGSFSAGSHTATVSFLNDAYGGTAATDRNLYVASATVDGAAVPNAGRVLLSAGPQSFSFTGPASATAPATTDTLDLHVSEDAWQGDAQYTVKIDGNQVGGVHTATALHGQGATQDVSLAGTWGAGPHTVGITFLNDAYGGTAATDRNLYVDGLTYDGQAASGAPATLLSSGTANFGLAGPAAATPLTLHLAEDAWQGNAQYAVAIDGTTVVANGTVTALNGSGQSQAVSLSALLSAGTHDVAISFLNDAYGGSSSTDRNLYVKGIDVNGTPAANASAVLDSNGTSHLQIVVPTS